MAVMNGNNEWTIILFIDILINENLTIFYYVQTKRRCKKLHHSTTK